MHEMRQAVLGQRQGRPCHKVHLANHKDKQLSGFSSVANWELAKLENQISGFSKLHTFYHFIIKSSVTFPLFVWFLFACPGMLIPPFTPCWKFSIIPVTQPSRRLSIHLFITLSSPQGVRAYPHPHGPEAGESRQFARSHARMTSISICI